MLGKKEIQGSVEGKCWIYQNQIATTSVDKWLNVVAKMADHRYPAAKKIVGRIHPCLQQERKKCTIQIQG